MHAQDEQEERRVTGVYLSGRLWTYEVLYRGFPTWTPDSDNGPQLEIQNSFGSIRIHVQATQELSIRTDRTIPTGDISVERVGDSFRIVALPSDKAALDLDIIAPYGMFIHAITTIGAIEYTGFGRAALKTDQGDVLLTSHWKATRFNLHSAEPPGEFQGDAEVKSTDSGWSARDRLSESHVAYGFITLEAARPRSIQLRSLKGVPEDSPIRMHWEAADLLP
ncbi:MAG: hypothetical protein GY953_21170, partial [bacterium]|nr:hypothetical protein [bacterium]